MTKNISIGALVAVVVVLGIMTLKQPTAVTDTVYKDIQLGSQSAPVVNVPAPVVNVAAPKVSVNVPEQQYTFGSVASPEMYMRTSMHRGFTAGGYVATSSTAATYTTNSVDFAEAPTTILWTPNVNTTVTLNATSTFYYVPDVGDVANVYLQNASTTAGATITLAAQNASVDLQFAEATGGDLVLSGLDWAKLTIIRQSTNKVTVIFDEMTEAD